MAKSGKCTITRDSYSMPNNTSTITVKGIITTSGESYRGDQRSGTYTIKQGSTVLKSGTFTHGAPANSTTTLFSVQLTVSHKSDGTSEAITASYNYDSSWCTGTGTLTLPTIPRQATITSAPNFNDEQNPAIGYSNSAGNTVSSLQACISLDGSKADIAYRDISKTGSTYTFSLTDEEREVLRNACTTVKSRTVYFYVKTVISGITYYSKVSRTLTIINATPTISATAVDTNSETVALTGDANVLVKYKSNAAVSMTATALKGASIKSYAIACGSKTLSIASGTLSAVESPTIVFNVTDSRGNTASTTLIKNMIEYIPLSCVFTPSQPNAEGDMDFAITGACYSGSFGSKSNSITVQYRYRADDETYSNWITLSDVTFADGKYTAKGSVTGLDYTKTYKFQARIVDSLGTAVTSEYGVSVNPVFYWGKDRFNFGVNVMFGNKTGYQDGKTGVYIDKKGFLHLQRDSSDGVPYLGFYVDDETEESGRIALDSGIMKFLAAVNGYKFDNRIITPNVLGIAGMRTDGVVRDLIKLNGYNNLTIGYDLYNNRDGNTYVYGNDVQLYSANAGNVGVKPYMRAGDTWEITMYTAGFITGSSKNVCFIIPVSVPIIGSPTVTVTSNNGLILRQGGSYTHGSSASAYVKPSSYDAVLYKWYGIRVNAVVSDTTNATNNSPIGITASVRITLS